MITNNANVSSVLIEVIETGLFYFLCAVFIFARKKILYSRDIFFIRVSQRAAYICEKKSVPKSSKGIIVFLIKVSQSAARE